jgi:hypothetical protein
MIGGWTVHCPASHLQTGEAEIPKAAQFKKLEASEEGGTMMQSYSKAEGLEAPWRVAGRSPSTKLIPTGMAAAKDALSQEEWSLLALASFLFFYFYSIQAPSLLDGAAHIQVGSFSLRYSSTHQSSLGTLCTDTPEVCFTNLRQLS